jgi:hypothetical protein
MMVEVRVDCIFTSDNVVSQNPALSIKFWGCLVVMISCLFFLCKVSLWWKKKLCSDNEDSATQNYRVFGLFPSSDILGNRKTTFQKLDLFLSSGGGGEKTPTQWGLLERANSVCTTPSSTPFRLLKTVLLLVL